MFDLHLREPGSPTTPRGSYAAFGARKQVAVVRRGLSDLLARHGLGDKPLKLVLNAYNMTFALEMPEGRVALRVHSGSTRSLEEIRGEIAWTHALHLEGRVSAPEPVGLFGGTPLGMTRIAGIERDVPVVAYTWLPGRHVGKNQPTRHAFLLGELMSRLHEMTRHWKLPVSTSRPVLADCIDGLPWRLPEDRTFREPFERANAVLRRLESTPRQLTHFDLHFGNVKVCRRRMSVFDFDDCLIAWPGADAAQAMFYLRREAPGDRLETAFWQGARTSPEELGIGREEFEWLVGGRALLLATDLAGTESASLAKIAPKYIEVTRRRLEYLLDTGMFDPSWPRCHKIIFSQRAISTPAESPCRSPLGSRGSERCG